MLFAYKPVPEYAYSSIQYLENDFIFGRLIRGMHYFSANLIVIAVFFHMLRVFFTGGYHGTRQKNWIIGLCIFGLILLSCFTGYLLPWDQTAFWAVTICLNMFDYLPAGSLLKAMFVDGGGISEKTLQIFFTFHTTLIPFTLIFFLAIHFWKIRKSRGVVTSGLNHNEAQKRPVLVETNPNLLLRELVAALLILAFVMLLALISSAPLGDMANEGLSPNPAKAPWYFSGFQELLFHFHPLVAVFIIPLAMVGVLFYLPFKQWEKKEEGVWFISENARKTAVFAFCSSIIIFLALIIMDEYILDFKNWFPNIPAVVSTGLIPLALLAGLTSVLAFGIKKKINLSRAETFQTTAVFYITAFIILTLTCTFFRGEGMKLIFGGI